MQIQYIELINFLQIKTVALTYWLLLYFTDSGYITHSKPRKSKERRFLSGLNALSFRADNSMKDDILKVMWGDEIAGYLTRAHSGSGRVQFEYNDEWLKNNRSAISLSMPTEAKKFDAQISTAFFENLLPESNYYSIICKSKHISEGDIFSFLRMFGNDCAGALVIIDDNIKYSMKYEYNDISEQLADMLQSDHPSLLSRLETKISLAGAQNKLPVYYKDGKFYIPVPDSHAPTNAIIKPEAQNFSDVHKNEAYCMALADRIGLNTAKMELIVVGGKQIYITHRYDRDIRNGMPVRLHQEDFCQALGYDRMSKYQIMDGPGHREIVTLLNSSQIVYEKNNILQYAKCAIFNYIIGNCDAHGKNFSLLHKREKEIELAPFYDLLSTKAYSDLDDKLAMSIGKTYKLDRIRASSWNDFANDISLDINDLRNIIVETSDAVKEHYKKLTIEHEQQYGSSKYGIYEKITKQIENYNEKVMKIADELDNRQTHQKLSAPLKVGESLLTAPINNISMLTARAEPTLSDEAVKEYFQSIVKAANPELRDDYYTGFASPYVRHVSEESENRQLVFQQTEELLRRDAPNCLRLMSQMNAISRAVDRSTIPANQRKEARYTGYEEFLFASDRNAVHKSIIARLNAEVSALNIR